MIMMGRQKRYSGFSWQGILKISMGGWGILSFFVSAYAAPVLPSCSTSPGLAMQGTPALPSSFDHFPYVNPEAPQGGKITLGVRGRFDNFNPFALKANSSAQGLVGAVYESLMVRSWDEPFTLYGLLVCRFELDSQREHLIFHLVSNAHFSDGIPLTSADVRFSFELLKEKGRPQQRAAYRQVRSLATPDPLTIIYDLTGSQDRELPLILGLMPVFSKSATKTETFSQGSLEIPIGSGPYKVESFLPGQKVVLKKDPHYWGQDRPVNRGRYNFDEIHFEYYQDSYAIYEAFKAGLIDYREETDPVLWRNGYDFPAVREGRILKESLPLGGVKGLAGFVFNTRRDIFKNKKVREALTYLFDFETLNATVFGNLYHRTESFFDESELSGVAHAAGASERLLLQPFLNEIEPQMLEGQWKMPQHRTPQETRLQARKALDLLSEAGWQVEEGKLKNKEGEPFTFEILIQDRRAETIALFYADSLRRVGIEAQIRLVDSVQYQRRRQIFDFDMTVGLFSASASPGNEQRGRWSSEAAGQDSSFNLAGVRSKAVDDMIQTVVGAQTREDFVSAVRALDLLLLSGFWVIPFYHASEQWTVYQADLAHPSYLARYAAPLFGLVLDVCWRKSLEFKR